MEKYETSFEFSKTCLGPNIKVNFLAKEVVRSLVDQVKVRYVTRAEILKHCQHDDKAREIFRLKGNPLDRNDDTNPPPPPYPTLGHRANNQKSILAPGWGKGPNSPGPDLWHLPDSFPKTKRPLYTGTSHCAVWNMRGVGSKFASWSVGLRGNVMGQSDEAEVFQSCEITYNIVDKNIFSNIIQTKIISIQWNTYLIRKISYIKFLFQNTKKCVWIKIFINLVELLWYIYC